MQIHAIAYGIGSAPRGSWLVHLARYNENLIWIAGPHPDYLNVNRNDLPSFFFSEGWRVMRKKEYYDFSYLPFRQEHLNEDQRD